MKSKRNKKNVFLFCTLLLIMVITGCKKEEEKGEKIKDLDFTVIEEADIPEELLTIINEKKEQAFKLSYTNDNYLYIARGYGAQKSGGYSIRVLECSLTDNAICFKTELIGPSEQDLVSQTVTHPYIVVKLEFIDKSVVFE